MPTEEIAVQAGDHDHIPLEPHPDVHEDRQIQNRTGTFDRTRGNQSSWGTKQLHAIMHPVGMPVRPEHPVLQSHELFVRVRRCTTR